MKLVEASDPILTSVCKGFDFQAPPFDPIEFAHELVKCLYDHQGIGIAANQVGVPYRVFAMRGHPENFVCYNPRIVQPSEQTIVLEEGCLTWPNLLFKIKRPQHIRMRWQMPNGETRTDTFTGISARIVQHEIDHLDGKVFWEGKGRASIEMAVKKAAKLGTKYHVGDLVKLASLEGVLL